MKNLQFPAILVQLLLTCNALVASTYSTSASVAITDQYTSKISVNVTGHHEIHDLDILVDITHPSVFDLELSLVAPDGNSICLNSYDFDEFFIDADYDRTIFDDDATYSIKQAAAPFRGRFKPIDKKTLAYFHGLDAHGKWTLLVTDKVYGDTGTINRFDVMITNPEPATIALLLAGSAIIRLRRKN